MVKNAKIRCNKNLKMKKSAKFYDALISRFTVPFIYEKMCAIMAISNGLPVVTSELRKAGKGSYSEQRIQIELAHFNIQFKSLTKDTISLSFSIIRLSA